MQDPVLYKRTLTIYQTVIQSMIWKVGVHAGWMVNAHFNDILDTAEVDFILINLLSNRVNDAFSEFINYTFYNIPLVFVH